MSEDENLLFLANIRENAAVQDVSLAKGKGEANDASIGSTNARVVQAISVLGRLCTSNELKVITKSSLATTYFKNEFGDSDLQVLNLLKNHMTNTWNVYNSTKDSKLQDTLNTCHTFLKLAQSISISLGKILSVVKSNEYSLDVTSVNRAILEVILETKFKLPNLNDRLNSHQLTNLAKLDIFLEEDFVI
ncbi:hypothetical protein QAD02_002854 [Eretmocerus hayati]|uniref:Uncharacterized protein n=1 Tax=Eretmocerus hayati TaxID=131215 RepID=A0ACC2NPZ7_9HYME|nr:hypothetical protein QAD02_002854 [Eretmocerus hayati]